VPKELAAATSAPSVSLMALVCAQPITTDVITVCAVCVTL
jgi:hypothetical protein